MQIVSIVLQALLGLMFVMSGGTKFTNKMEGEFQRYGLGTGFRYFTGLVEILGAVGLIAGIWLSDYIVWSAALLAVTMFFAALAHIVRAKDPIGKAVPAIVLLLLNVIIIIINL